MGHLVPCWLYLYLSVISPTQPPIPHPPPHVLSQDGMPRQINNQVLISDNLYQPNTFTFHCYMYPCHFFNEASHLSQLFRYSNQDHLTKFSMNLMNKYRKGFCLLFLSGQLHYYSYLQYKPKWILLTSNNYNHL